jgi:predicted phage tail protein
MSINARDKQIALKDGVATQSYASREQLISVTDMICEGPIEGLVEGTASVYLNDESMVFTEGRSYSGEIDGVKITTTVTSSQGIASVSDLPVLDDYENRRVILRGVATSLSATLGAIRASADNEDVTAVTISTPNDLNFFDSTYAYLGRPPARVTFTVDGKKVTLKGNITKRLNSYTAELTLTNTSSTIFAEYGTQNSVDLIIDWENRITNINSNSITFFQGVPFSGTFVADIGEPYITGAGADSYSSYENKYKFEGTSIQFRPGTQDQEVITNYGLGTAAVRITNAPADNDLEFIDANSEDPNATPANPPVFRGTASGGFNLSSAQAKEVDEVRLIFSYASLFYQNLDKGNLAVAGAGYKIELKLYRGSETSDVVLEERRVHFAKSRSEIVLEEIINLEAFKPFDDFEIKVTRLTRHDGLGVSSDTLSNYGTNKDKHVITAPAKITSVSAVIKEQLNYPYTSLSNLTFSSKQFGQMPTRTYHLRGLKVFVPSNYTTREAKKLEGQPYDVDDLYSGAFWDGSMSDEPVYTDNPAWIFYDILTNNRYGLGAYLKEFDIDKYSLYRIGKYCDELVDDGNGGTEPRYTANIFLQKQADAYKVLKDFATSFLGMIYWIEGKVTAVADQPTDAIYTFSKGNVIDGAFEYESSGQKTRANQIVVNWINPANNYRQETLIVEDRDNIVKTGKIVREDAVAFGCTSEGQATRYGRWKLYTAINQTEMVSFNTSINAAFLSPGDVIKVQDADKYKLAYSGKATGTPTTTSIPLDRTITLNSGSSYELSVLLSDDESGYESEEAQRPIKVETQTVSTSAGSVSSLTVDTAFSEAPKAGTVWVLREVTSNGLDSSASAKEYRILSISENSANDYSISALEYYSNKYDTIEGEFSLVVPDTVYPKTDPTEVPPAPTNIYVESQSDFNKAGDEFSITWEAPTDYDKISGYEIHHNVPDYQNPIEISGSEIKSYKFEGVPDSTYRVAVSTLNTVNNRSKATPIVFSVKDKFFQKCNRAEEGVPIGAQVTSGLELTASYLLQFKTSTIGIATAGNPADVYTSSNPATLNTIQSSIANGTYYVLFDRSAESLKPIVHKTNNTLGVTYWYDDTANEFTNQSGTVSVSANTTKVTGTGSNFDGDFEVGDIIKFSSSRAAKVTYIESDTIMYIDRSFTNAITGVTPARQTLQIDFTEDAILGKVTKSGSTSTFQTLVTSGLQVSSLSEITNDLGTVSSGSFGGTVTGSIEGASISNSTITGSTFDGTAKLVVQEDATQESDEITTLNFSTGLNLETSGGVATISVDAADNVLTNEQVQDIVGNMVTGNSEGGITVTYQDGDGTLDFSVASQTDNNFTTALKNKLDGIAANANNYSLPTATASVLGGIKVGDNLTITNGVLSADTQAGTYSLPTATASVLGGIKVGDNLTITNGVLSADTQSGTYTLPTATDSVLGGVKIGDGITIASGVISADSQTDNNFTTTLKDKLDGIADNANNYSLPTATGAVLGGVKIGTRISINNGVISADSQTDQNFTTTLKSKLDGIDNNANNYSLPTATSGTLGGVKIGDGISIDVNGVISADNQDTDTTYSISAVDSGDDALIRLTAGGDGSGTDDVKLAAGSNITITPVSDTITISSTDTNTTYSAGNGITLTGTSFSADPDNPANKNVAVAVGSSGISADVKDGGIENVHLAVDTISLDKIAISEFPTVVWKTKFSTRDGSPDSNGEFQAYEGGAFTNAADNGEAWNSITGIRVFETDADGRNLTALLSELVANKSYIRIRASENNFGTYKVTSVTDSGAYYTLGLTFFNKSDSGAYANTGDVYVEFQVKTDAVIDGNLIVTGTVTADAIAANTITATEIAADAITANEIAANTITASQIAADAITATEIAANTITASQIAADAITANEIAANAVTADAIAANTITSNEIAANTITASQIAADAITASEIATNAVTADAIAANTITASEIAADAITASEIATNAVTADAIAANAVTANEIAANTITASQIAADAITANEIATNAVTADAIAANTITASEIAANAITATEIATNAVTADAIAANTITASEIAADAITATEIATNAVTADAIAANTITASEIAADAITATEIATNAVTADAIAANTITASEIAADAITANEIAANAVTADAIAAGAITADDITTGTLDANSVTVSNLRADDISGGVSEVFEQSFVVPAGQTITSAFSTIVDFDLQAPQHNISKYFTVQGLFGFYILDSSGSIQVGNIVLDVQRKSKGTGSAGAINVGTQVDVGTAGSYNYWVEVSGDKTADINYFAKLSKASSGMYAKNITGVRYIASTNRTRIFYSDSSQHYTAGNNHAVYVSPDAWASSGTWVSTGRGSDSFMVTTKNYSTITNTFAYIGSYGVFDEANEFRIQAKTQSLTGTTTFRRFVGTAEYKV